MKTSINITFISDEEDFCMAHLAEALNKGGYSFEIFSSVNSGQPDVWKLEPKEVLKTYSEN
jgi:hypothetical protein